MLLFEAISRIEISFRTRFIYELAFEYGPFPLKKRISSFYGLSPIVLTSWLRVLSLIRNICAHHERLWNKILPFSISLPKHTTNDPLIKLFVSVDDENFNSKRIYNPIIAMQYLLNQIGLDEKNSLLFKISALIEKYHITNYKRMGMPCSLESIIPQISEYS